MQNRTCSQSKLKLVSFHIQAHLNAFLQILEYISEISLGPVARESLCIRAVTVVGNGGNKECQQRFAGDTSRQRPIRMCYRVNDREMSSRTGCDVELINS